MNILTVKITMVGKKIRDNRFDNHYNIHKDRIASHLGNLVEYTFFLAELISVNHSY